MAYTLREWRKLRQEGQRLVLPSGLTMSLREVGVLDLVEQGRIPAPLLEKVERMVSRGGAISVKLEDVTEYIALLDITLKAAAVEPEVADVGSDDVLGLDELSNRDKVAVFEWANTGVEPLIPFRKEAG